MSILPAPAMASEAQKLSQAYQLLTQHRCAEAIPLFDALYWTSPAYFNEALFYIIFCQDQLGQLFAAQNNIQHLNLTVLSAKKQKKIREIQAKVPVTSFSVWTTNTYAGVLEYLNTQPAQSGYYIGLGGSWNNATTRIGVNTERLSINTASASLLNQFQFSAYYSQTWSEHWLTRISGFYLSNDDATTDQGKVGGIWLAYLFSAGSLLGSESFYSIYPATAQLNVLQESLFFSFPVFREGGSSLFLELKGKVILPHSTSVLLGSYSEQIFGSGEMTFRLTLGSHAVTLGAWLGRRFFAIQNDGATVMNVGLLRQGGARLTYNFFHSLHWQLGVFGIYESFLNGNTSGTPTSSTLAVGGAVSLFL